MGTVTTSAWISKEDFKGCIEVYQMERLGKSIICKEKFAKLGVSNLDSWVIGGVSFTEQGHRRGSYNEKSTGLRLRRPGVWSELSKNYL